MTAYNPSLEDLLDAINYTIDTSNYTATPPNCFDFDCQIVDSFRQLCKANQYLPSSNFPYAVALKLLNQLNSKYLPAGFFIQSDISTLLSVNGFTTSSVMTFDEIVCIIKVMLGKISKKTRDANGGYLDPELQGDLDNAESMNSYLPNKKCKKFDLGYEYFDQ